MKPRRVEIYCGDAVKVAETLAESAFDAALTDPPYELGLGGYRWDATAVSLKNETWAEILRVCKPGAPFLAFSATRTYHRIASAMEEGGWNIRDCLQWLRGNGFPKNRNLDTDLPATWKGYGNVLRPGHDPIILAQKPLNGTRAQNALQWGCGLLNINACRIPGGGKAKFPNGKYSNPGLFGVGSRRNGQDLHPDSRCTTNVMLDDDAACLLDGQEAGASRFFYCSRATTWERNAGLPPGMKNDHPCVKPLRLCRYLATLVLPPPRETPRRLLVPFSGTGSEIIGALLAGWDEVVGIELNQRYIRIAEQRIRHWIFSQTETHVPSEGRK
jgi:site-specific DNA-methyltransferase (adenine-specific)